MLEFLIYFLVAVLVIGFIASIFVALIPHVVNAPFQAIAKRIVFGICVLLLVLWSLRLLDMAPPLPLHR